MRVRFTVSFGAYDDLFAEQDTESAGRSSCRANSDVLTGRTAKSTKPNKRRMRTPTNSVELRRYYKRSGTGPVEVLRLDTRKEDKAARMGGLLDSFNVPSERTSRMSPGFSVEGRAKI